METPITVTFSEAEYRRLITLTLMGEWMVNAVQKEPDLAYEELASKIYSHAKGTALEPLTVFDEQENVWIPEDSFEEEVHNKIDEYDDCTFWEELTARLVDRDLIDQYGERSVKSMHPSQRERAATQIARAYTREFEDVGLERLRIVE